MSTNLSYNINIMQQKKPITSDGLYELLNTYGVKHVRIAELVGLSEASLNSCFNHYKGFKGLPRGFNSAMAQKLTNALEQVADAIRSRKLVYGKDLTKPNNRGKVYDHALVDALKEVGKWVNLTFLVEKALGWKKDKKKNTLVSRNSKAYGCVSEEDANKVNVLLEEIAKEISSYEVVPDGEESDNNKGTRAPVRNEWDDTSVDLLERYAAFHRLFPDGLIGFAVHDGFTVCEDDARLLARIDTTLQPYTDIATGHVTLHMDAKKWKQIRRAWDDGDEMVAETPMYEQ